MCFSSVVRKVSLADPSISVPVHWNPDRFGSNPRRKEEVSRKIKQLKDVDVFEKFELVCKANIERVSSLNSAIRDGVTTRVVSKDARNLGIPDESVDMILTSPPYAGAQKYIRASWLNLFWLDLVKLEDIKELKTHNIGREDALDESFRVLKTGGHMVIVIGNNTVCKRQFDTQDYLTTYLVGKGMQLQFKLIDDIKSYGLMTKRNKTADMITREWILVLKK